MGKPSVWEPLGFQLLLSDAGCKLLEMESASLSLKVVPGQPMGKPDVWKSLGL